MNIIQDIINKNRYSRPGIKLNKVRGIVIHWVANPMSTAKGNRDFFNNLNGSYASAHFVIGINGEIIQCLPLDELAYHVGSKTYTSECINLLEGKPNYNTIGIELCHPDWTGKFSDATINACIKLLAKLCKDFNLNPIRDIWTHKGVVGWKDCPLYFVNNPIELENFKNKVVQELMKDYKQILQEAGLSNPEKWIQIISDLESGSIKLEDIQYLKFFKALIEKLGNK